MDKYYLKETGEEIQFGDILELDLTETKGNKEIHKHVECKFHPILVDALLEQDIIEAGDDEEETEEEVCLEEKVEELEDRIIELEGVIAELRDKLDE